MAYIRNPTEDTSVFQQLMSPGSSGGGTSKTTPLASTPASAGAAPMSAGGTPQSASSGQFVNFQQYLDANRDLSKQFGTQIANNVGNQGQQSQNWLQNAQNQFYAGTAPYGQSGPNAAGPTSGTNTTNAYTGPASLAGTAGWDQAYQQAGNIGTNAQALAQWQQNPALAQAYLQKQYGTPAGYGSAFDQALIGATSAPQLAAAGQKWQGLQNLFDTANQQSTQAATAARNFQPSPAPERKQRPEKPESDDTDDINRYFRGNPRLTNKRRDEYSP